MGDITGKQYKGLMYTYFSGKYQRRIFSIRKLRLKFWVVK